MLRRQPPIPSCVSPGRCREGAAAAIAAVMCSPERDHSSSSSSGSTATLASTTSVIDTFVSKTDTTPRRRSAADLMKTSPKTFPTSNNKPHFSAVGMWRAPNVPNKYSSMCFEGSRLVLPNGLSPTSAPSPTSAAHHAALAPPFLRASVGGASPSHHGGAGARSGINVAAAPASVVKTLARAQFDELTELAQQHQREQMEELQDARMREQLHRVMQRERELNLGGGASNNNSNGGGESSYGASAGSPSSTAAAGMPSAASSAPSTTAAPAPSVTAAAHIRRSVVAPPAPSKPTTMPTQEQQQPKEQLPALERIDDTHFHVNWREWGDDVFRDAAKQNKLILLRVFDAKQHQHPQTTTTTTTIVGAASAKHIGDRFLTVAVDWSTDAEVCTTYHNYLSDRLQTSHGMEGLSARTEALLSTPDAPSEFDVILLPDGRPVHSTPRHLKDDAAATTADDAVIGYDADAESWCAVPRVPLDLVLELAARSWTRDSNLRQRAIEEQQVHTHVRAPPRSSVSQHAVNNMALSAIDDFNFLISGDPQASWQDLASKPANFVNGMVPLFIDAQHTFLVASAEGSTVASMSSSATAQQQPANRSTPSQILDGALATAWGICKAGEADLGAQPLDALAEGALLALLISQQQQQLLQQQGGDEQAAAAAAACKWMPALKQRLSALRGSNSSVDGDAVSIPKAVATSAALVKVVQALVADVSVAAAAAATHSDLERDLRATLELGVWAVSVLFERARCAKSERTAAIDSVHAWVALTALTKLVGHNDAMAGEVLRAASEGVTEGLRPLHRAWQARSKGAARRVKAQKSMRENFLRAMLNQKLSTNPFAKRFANFNSNKKQVRKGAGGGGSKGQQQQKQQHDAGKYAQQAQHAQAATSRATSSWFMLAPLAEAEVDLDDAIAMLSTTSNSNNKKNDASATELSDDIADGTFDSVDGEPSAAAAAAAAAAAESAEATANSSDQADDAWMVRVLTKAISFPIAMRQQQQPKPDESANAAASQAQAEAQKKKQQHDDTLWAAANLVWSGAPRIDRSEVLNNALRTLDLLHHTLAPATTSEQASARSAFVRLYFSLRQLSALMLTANSRRRGDCLACHGQLIGTVLTTSSSPTVVVAPVDAKSHRRQQQPPLEPFTLLDFGAFPHRALEKPVDVARTADKFVRFLTAPSAAAFRSALAESTCLSMASHVIVRAVAPQEDLVKHKLLLKAKKTSSGDGAAAAAAAAAAIATAGDAKQAASMLASGKFVVLRGKQLVKVDGDDSSSRADPTKKRSLRELVDVQYHRDESVWK